MSHDHTKLDREWELSYAYLNFALSKYICSDFRYFSVRYYLCSLLPEKFVTVLFLVGKLVMTFDPDLVNVHL